MYIADRHLSWFLTVWYVVAGRRQQSVAAQHPHAQQLVQADAAPTIPIGINGLSGKLPSSGVRLLKAVSAHGLSLA